MVRRINRGGLQRVAILAVDGLRELGSWEIPAAAVARWCPTDASLDALWCAVSRGGRHELHRYSLRGHGHTASSRAGAA